MNTKKIFLSIIVTLFTLQLGAMENAENIGEFFTKGTYDLKMTLGYEYSGSDNSGKSPGKGLMLSSFLGYRTAEYQGFSLYGQFHNMTKVWDEYHDGNGKYSSNDSIADPDGNRIHQLYADFTNLPSTRIRIGRQEIVLDDSRFFGNIGWRLNAQSFDAITLLNKSIPDTQIFLGYSENVASILLNENEYDGIYIANIKHSGIKGHNQTVFAYLVDADENNALKGPSVGHDVQTFGGRLNGELDALKYDFTYAHQSSWKDSDDIDVNFFQGELAYIFGSLTPGIGYAYHEGSDNAGGKGFSNLFSTAHAFNGWADQFLATNNGGLANGLQDYHASLTYKQWGMTFKAAYHYFDTTENHSYSDDYGQEIDFLVSTPINDQLTATAKLAYFDASSSAEKNSVKEDKLVLWLRFSYTLQGKITEPFNL